MRELKLIAAESNAKSLVFGDVESDQQYFIEVTDDVATELLAALDSPIETLDSFDEAGQGDASENQGADADNTATSSDESGNASATSSEEPAQAVQPPKEPTPVTEMDPRLSAPLRMRPREIQDRVRAGATIAELAEENDVSEARIEPFAHPVLLERARVAEMAKQSHPVREDGPAKLTLWEVLATAFAARGNDLSTSEWDAYKDASGQWVVRVSWRAGLAENVAEWSYHQHSMTSATAVARNGIAADLIDPDFAQPVRSLSAVQRPRPLLSDPLEDELDDYNDQVSGAERTRDDIPVVRDDAQPADRAEQSERGEVVEGDENFLQHPDAEQRPSKRRRKAVTPHWEDVLLGVRTNTKRPRS